ncbi:MAG: hypothetical protein JRJ19_12300, partial [Deltaproteobacteria bacterium]|nr:hypothetical protein [Deltaproteobacteria bacterium]
MRGANRSRWAIFATAGLIFVTASCQVNELVSLTGEHKLVVEVPADVDILFVIDNSGSMKTKQPYLAGMLADFVDIMKQRGVPGRYQIAVVTTGMESEGCPRCGPAALQSCVNQTGENGRFQDLVGEISFNGEAVAEPIVDESCRVVGHDLGCFYDMQTSRGIAVVNPNGCGYERGLAAMRNALGKSLVDRYNAGFLRDNAKLVVVVISDEEDCGENGDVAERIPGVESRTCYYAAKGTGPDDSRSHIDDPASKTYKLAPVDEYFHFLLAIKNHTPGMTQFVAIVGITDPGDPLATAIEFESNDANANILPACRIPSCLGGMECEAFPGTRYIELARMFGLGRDGMVESICQNNFADTITRLAE